MWEVYVALFQVHLEHYAGVAFSKYRLDEADIFLYRGIG